jgi:hypothetical protein
MGTAAGKGDGRRLRSVDWFGEPGRMGADLPVVGAWLHTRGVRRPPGHRHREQLVVRPGLS